MAAKDGRRLVEATKTKDTAQRTSSGWNTAPATPGIAPVIGAEATQNETIEPEKISSGSTGVAVAQGDTPQYELVLPDLTLQLAVEAPAIIHVGQPIDFTVIPSGVGDTIARSLTYQWSMGNGDLISGKDTTYTYLYPGEYVVVVSGEFKRQIQSQRHQITVLPVQLELSLTDKHYVVKNISDTEIDIGEYQLVGVHTHVFPKHTIILPNTEVVIPVQVTTVFPAMVALYNVDKRMVASHVPVRLQQVSSARTLANTVRTYESVAMSHKAAQPAIQTQQFGFVSETVTATKQSQVPSDPGQVVEIVNPAIIASSTTAGQQRQWPVIAFGILLLLGILAIYFVPQKEDSAPFA